MSACEVMDKQIKKQGRVGLARVLECEVMLACEILSACVVMEKQIKNQGRVSLERVSACQIILAREFMSGCGCHLVR